MKCSLSDTHTLPLLPDEMLWESHVLHAVILGLSIYTPPAHIGLISGCVWIPVFASGEQESRGEFYFWKWQIHHRTSKPSRAGHSD